jgi:hypothetical protein
VLRDVFVEADIAVADAALIVVKRPRCAPM